MPRRWRSILLLAACWLAIIEPRLQCARAADIEGKIGLKASQTSYDLQIGCIGKDAKGQKLPDSMIGATISMEDAETSVANESYMPRVTALVWKKGKGCTFKHTNLPPGEYFIYLRSGERYFDWRIVRIKNEKEKLAVNLAVDPLETSSIEVTVSGKAEAKEVRFQLLDNQGKLPLGDIEFPQFNNGEPLKKGKVVFDGMHTGKYRFRADEATVDAEVKKYQRVKVELKAIPQ
jgi:hypothetical protein